jgi:hypothetical protein
MAKPNPRIHVVKTLLNADEFIEFDRACSAAGEPHSRVLRDLARNWFTPRPNHIPGERRKERTKPVRNLAMFCPGRRVAPAPHARC